MAKISGFPHTRLRRLRQHSQLRRLTQDTHLQVGDFIMPLFIRHGDNGNSEPRVINSMPGQYQYTVAQAAKQARHIEQLGIPAVLLFGIPEHKDAHGSDSLHDAGIIQQAIVAIKEVTTDLLIITDVCFCEYTDHGHCGVIENQDVHNDKTLALISKQAVSHAKAGADMVAPSGMMDGAVAALRNNLDKAGFENIPVMSYAVKYASGFYGPFREAAEGAPQFGNRQTYQMDPANKTECLREAELDIQEGADILMVKPAMAYLDIIHKIKQQYQDIPLAAYQVSGEYAMIKAAAQNNWIDEQAVMLESLLAIKRAGADIIISYYAMDVAKYLLGEK